MTLVSKLSLALIAGALVISSVDVAFATKPQLPPVMTPRQEQTPPELPSRAPRQLFPEKRIQPLTPEIEQSLIPKDSFRECDVCPEMVDWSANMVRSGYRESAIVDGGGHSFRVVRTLNVPL